MCGIAGVWGAPDEARRTVRAMLPLLAHRGPDDEGLWESSPLGSLGLVFGFRRLAILDTSPSGHQPMLDPASGSVLVFNGEIYNFLDLRREWSEPVWESRSDTEVLLKGFLKWGHDLWPKLAGMYAVALFDAPRRRLILARDPLGIKPLYYGWNRNGSFFFCSEIRSLVRCRLADGGMDLTSLFSCLAYGAPCEPLTLVEGVRMLGAGEWMELGLERGRIRVLDQGRFWEFPKAGSFQGTREEAVLALRRALDTALRRHLLSDVPVGLFLSAGMDSAAVAAFCRRNGLTPRAWTLYLEGEGGHDERMLAAETARQAELPHEIVTLSPSELANTWDAYMASLDQPTVDGFNTWLIARVARKQGYKVALSGLGGDELFGGYSSVRHLPWLVLASRLLGLLPSPLQSRLLNCLWPAASSAQREKLKDLFRAPRSAMALALLRRRLFGEEALNRLGLQKERWALNPYGLPLEANLNLRGTERDLPALIGLLDGRFYMRNILLRDADVMGMTHSVEIRVPLLDRDVASLAFAFPGRWRRPAGGVNKPLLADAAELPAAIRQRPKTIFALPFPEWLRTIWKERMADNLSQLAHRGLLDPAGIHEIRRRFEAPGGGGWWSRIWMLVVLNEWLNRVERRE